MLRAVPERAGRLLKRWAALPGAGSLGAQDLHAELSTGIRNLEGLIAEHMLEQQEHTERLVAEREAQAAAAAEAEQQPSPAAPEFATDRELEEVRALVQAQDAAADALFQPTTPAQPGWESESWKEDEMPLDWSEVDVEQPREQMDLDFDFLGPSPALPSDQTAQPAAEPTPATPQPARGSRLKSSRQAVQLQVSRV